MSIIKQSDPMNSLLCRITSPTLLLDKQRCVKNIDNMYLKAQRSGVSFRPHFKTHQSLKVGQWFREAGTKAITVSSVRMADYFANDGWKDITIAFPVNIREMEAINHLAGKIKLNILITSKEVILFLEKHLRYPVGVFIEIDTGYHRTGIDDADLDSIQEIIDRLDRNSLFQFSGFLNHTGQTYKSSSSREIMSLYQGTVDKLVNLKESIHTARHRITLSMGDTPSCTLVNRFEKIDEIRPGNFVFFDLMQYHLGVCTPGQIAVVMAAPVVAKYPERNEIVIYGGAVHLSKEFILLPSGKRSYGGIVQFNETGWNEPEDDCYVSALSQEHGMIHAGRKLMNRNGIGDLIGIIPVHSCLTANLMKGYLTMDGEEIDHMMGRMNGHRAWSKGHGA
jgi:D-serine deaminase-like pyridoxal phosphate-dependent protein